jgi:hypothetical protein
MCTSIETTERRKTTLVDSRICRVAEAEGEPNLSRNGLDYLCTANLADSCVVEVSKRPP